jgi:ribosomal protein L32
MSRKSKTDLPKNKMIVDQSFGKKIEQHVACPKTTFEENRKNGCPT